MRGGIRLTFCEPGTSSLKTQFSREDFLANYHRQFSPRSFVIWRDERCTTPCATCSKQASARAAGDRTPDLDSPSFVDRVSESLTKPNKKPTLSALCLARVEGFEPPIMGPEPIALPLGYTLILICWSLAENLTTSQ